MKKLIALMLLIAGASLFVSCTLSPMEIKAPAGKEVVLASGGATKAKVSKRVMFLFGVYPMGDNSTADLINQVNAKKVVVKTGTTFIDQLIAGFTLLILQPRTIEVEAVE